MADVAGRMEVILENRPMGLERNCRDTVSPARPSSLLLEDNNNMLYGGHHDDNNSSSSDGLTADIMSEDSVTNAHNCRRQRRRKRAPYSWIKRFSDVYVPTGEMLGEGSQGSVRTYRNTNTNKEYAVKIIAKNHYKNRNKVLKEIEIFHHCKGQENILQLMEYYEEEDLFYVVFEKMEGGTLFETIERRRHITEQEASQVVQNIATALHFLHQKGIAHRDLKPENILCTRPGHLTPVKLCDFDLGSGIVLGSKLEAAVTTPELQTPVGSAEFMAPEVVDVWQDMAWSYDKKCDLWSLGIILYIMLCGYPPFYVDCGDDCGWNAGEACQACQTLLFKRIQEGVFDFDVDDWAGISDAAKDLIRHLLVKDPYDRYTAAQVLQHPWVTMESPKTLLATPRILLRNNSTKELQNFAENAVAMNRLLLRHLSVSSLNPPRDMFAVNETGCGDSVTSDDDEASETIFHMDSDLDASDGGGDGGDAACPAGWGGVSPPGRSALARRRHRLGSSGGDDAISPPLTRFASAMF